MTQRDPKENLNVEDMQGLLLGSYGKLPFACYVLIAFGNGNQTRAWLSAFKPNITTAIYPPPRDKAINIAFTYAGLKAFELNAPTLRTFPHELREGMTTPHRQRILGDTDDSAPSGWEWGGTDFDKNPEIHAALFIYANSVAQLESAYQMASASFAAHGITVIKRLDAGELAEHEHFGFRDGISQPIIEGTDHVERVKAEKEKNAQAKTKSDQVSNCPTEINIRPVKPGEFYLGYLNDYGQFPDSPRLKPPTSDKDVSKFKTRGLNDIQNLGLNGSYVVFRQLEQDVAQFWQFMLSQAKNNKEGIEGIEGIEATEAIRLASKMVGRWPSGAPITCWPEQDNPAHADENSFGYADKDAQGTACPFGAHIRRTNPRDMLETAKSNDALEIVNKHRILRRGRNYGPPLGANPDEIMAALRAGTANTAEKRGLMFICLNANIQRQFEFIQHTWCNNAKFETLYDEVDVISGATSTAYTNNHFTMPSQPVRERVSDVPRFVRVRGGAYFFMPGIQALQILAAKQL